MKLVGLSRQIALSMILIAAGTALLALLGSFLFYYLWAVYWPSQVPEEVGLAPSWPEWAWIAATVLTAMALAMGVAVKLARRILQPLNSVAEGLRCMARGDLEARAIAADPSLGEAAHLVDDFNTLADKLRQMSEEQVFWNAAIAHELRTPVTILRGRLQGLADGVFAPEPALFHRLLSQVEGLTRLLEDLRVVSLAESGHLRLQWQSVDLADEIRDVVELCAPMLQLAQQSVELELTAEPVSCDPARIRQALLALLENARCYAQPGVIRIRSELRDGHYHLCVEDQGPGVPPELVTHIFTAFRRAADDKTAGSGLGLAVVAAIASAHHGSARCYPAPSGGSVFELCWPIQGAAGQH